MTRVMSSDMGISMTSGMNKSMHRAMKRDMAGACTA